MIYIVCIDYNLFFFLEYILKIVFFRFVLFVCLLVFSVILFFWYFSKDLVLFLDSDELI